MLDAEHLKAILVKYEGYEKFDLSSRIAISKGRIKPRLKSNPPSLIDDLELTPTIFFDGREYSLYKQANGWYLYRGPQFSQKQNYRWLTCYSKEVDGKQYAAKPYRKSINAMSHIGDVWPKVLSGAALWTIKPDESEIDWELYKKPIYEIIDKNFFKRQPKRK